MECCGDNSIPDDCFLVLIMSAESKEKIVRGALEMFMAQGIKSVTMDKIAGSLSVSKRTIYEHFADKEALVAECLSCFKSDMDEKRSELKNTTANTFSYLLEMFKYSVSVLRKVNVNFFTDSEAMFPDIIKNVKLNKKAQIDHFKNLIIDAQRDGHIIKSFSPDVLAELYYEMLGSMRSTDSYDYARTPSSEILRILCNVYFRGVATEKGLLLIDDLLGSDAMRD